MPGREIELMEVVRFDAGGEQRAHQRFQRGDGIVDAFNRSTLWLTSAMPASAKGAHAVRAAAVNSERVIDAYTPT